MDPSDIAPGEPTQQAATLDVRSDRIVLAGTLAWALALAAVLAVPSWHSGARGWWPWACATGLALGLVGWVYLRRGRGNAAEANDPVAVPPGAVQRVEQVRRRRATEDPSA